MEILQAQNVHYIYQSKYQKVHAVKGIDFTFQSGKFYAIVGKSGCGKTTFLSLLAGLDLPTEGKIVYGGKARENVIEMITDEKQCLLFPRVTIYFRC